MRSSAAGATTSADRCRAQPRPSRYAESKAQRESPPTPARSDAKSSTQPSRNASAYTSVSVALSQSVDIPPATRPAQIAPALSPVHLEKSAEMSAQPAAVAAAESKSTERANPKSGAKRKLQTFATSTKRAVPAGWGIPSVRIAARNSPESQRVRTGARVSQYTSSRMTPVTSGADALDLI